MNTSDTTVADLNNAVAQVEDLMRNDMNPISHVRLERLQSLVARIDKQMLKNKQNFVPEKSLEEVRKAFDEFLDGMPSV